VLEEDDLIVPADTVDLQLICVSADPWDDKEAIVFLDKLFPSAGYPFPFPKGPEATCSLLRQVLYSGDLVVNRLYEGRTILDRVLARDIDTSSMDQQRLGEYHALRARIVELLVDEFGANLNQLSNDLSCDGNDWRRCIGRQCPVQALGDRADFEGVELLLHLGADVDRALFKAIRAGNLPLVKTLVPYVKDLSKPIASPTNTGIDISNSATPLHWARTLPYRNMDPVRSSMIEILEPRNDRKARLRARTQSLGHWSASKKPLRSRRW
jgi:hypothetical protein